MISIGIVENRLDTRQSHLLKICLFATGCSGIVAEFTLSTLASYLLGNTTLQWTLTMSVMLFAMGLGSRWSRLLPDRLLDRFIAIEFWLSALCATCAAAAYLGSALIHSSGVVIYGYAFAIGVLIGMEIPLVARLNASYEELETNISSVMEKDYFGALLGWLLFAFFALPHLGLTYTPLALGAINFVVASVLLWRYRSLLITRMRLMIAFWGLAIGLVVLGVWMRPIVMFGEQSQYRDRVVFQKQTPYQRIVITKWKDHHWLYLNNNVQFSTYDEMRYHEPLIHPSMQLAGSRERVLILGGGDGLAVREVMKYPDVKRVTLVDLDAEMISLARSYPALRAANRGSLDDPRLDVVTGDAGKFLANSSDLYDVIVIDLPDPKGPDLARLYSREFYRECLAHLSVDGVVVTQASSPLHAKRAFLCVHQTMQAAGFAVVPYHTYVPTMSDWGWVLGVRKKWGRGLKARVSTLDFEGVDTQYLNAEVMAGMLSFGKGTFDDLQNIAVSTELDPKVDQYYRESEWGW
ncbi:MAG: polyamine aminopropyltransferase [Candidatus Latescibacteria bacterium]|nr:polyamine aminopropyltransferase [Candidatus Latescibacterota bacterium]